MIVNKTLKLIVPLTNYKHNTLINHNLVKATTSNLEDGNKLNLYLQYTNSNNELKGYYIGNNTYKIPVEITIEDYAKFFEADYTRLSHRTMIKIMNFWKTKEINLILTRRALDFNTQLLIGNKGIMYKGLDLWK